MRLLTIPILKRLVYCKHTINRVEHEKRSLVNKLSLNVVKTEFILVLFVRLKS